MDSAGRYNQYAENINTIDRNWSKIKYDVP